MLKMFCNQHLLVAIRGELSFGLEQEEWGREGGEKGGGGEGCKRRMHKCSTRVRLRFALLSLKVSTSGFLGTRGICLRYITNITSNFSSQRYLYKRILSGALAVSRAELGAARPGAGSGGSEGRGGAEGPTERTGNGGVVVEWGEAGEGRSLICSKQELRHWRNSLRHLCVCVYVRLKLWVEQSRGVDATRRVNAC